MLDLGCGAGALLDHLVRARGVRGTGVEHDEVRASAAIAKGLSVIHGDIFEEIADYRITSYNVCYTKLLRFTAMEGADAHCQAPNQRLFAAELYDWLDGLWAG